MFSYDTEARVPVVHPPVQLRGYCRARGHERLRACRQYDCPQCGLVLDRDVNAARNILARAYPERDGAGDSPRSARSAQADALGIVA